MTMLDCTQGECQAPTSRSFKFLLKRGQGYCFGLRWVGPSLWPGCVCMLCLRKVQRFEARLSVQDWVGARTGGFALARCHAQPYSVATRFFFVVFVRRSSLWEGVPRGVGSWLQRFPVSSEAC
ncbi:unnamed protein product [Discosporangium mesarthrocarpum]